MTAHPDPGTRIELLDMPEDPSPIEAGALGTVESVVIDPLGDGRDQVHVKWDNGRTLSLCVPPDRYRVVEEAS